MRFDQSTMRRALRAIDHHYSALGVVGVLLLLISRVLRTQLLFKKEVAGLKHPVYVRIGTSDVWVFRQVLLERQYDFQLPISPKLIIDAGANIGLSAVFFANRYPGAKIVAIEPESSNVRILRKNAAPYPQITVLEAALWWENREILLLDVGQGNDAFQTKEESEVVESPSRGFVKGVTIDAVMKDAGADSVDVLKIDIEGSEKEVFENCSPWIDNVSVIMVELHDHLKAGCVQSFSDATKAFVSELTKGETVMRARREICELLPEKP